MNIVKEILGGVAAPVVDYLKRRMEIAAEDRQQDRALKRAEVERRIELIKSGLTADMNWEMEFARQASSSWKDEYTLLVVSIPAVMAFIPGLSVFVARGFDALATTPIWYQTMLVAIFFATYGMRFWRRTQSDS